MFRKLRKTVREFTGPQGFEAYLWNVQKMQALGLPTRDEAFKDFRSIRRPL